MRIPRIFSGRQLEAGQVLELEAGPAGHVARVLRMAAGDALVLFDGRGGEFPATLLQCDRKAVTAKLAANREREVESPLQVHLGIAISRGERMDWVVQKATELGVAAITPLFSGRTEVKLRGERAAKKLQHWGQVAISACEQCGRNRLPVIGELCELDGWLQGVAAESRLVLHHRAGPSPLAAPAPTSVALLVGPEGGLSAAEIELAERRGFQSLALGPRVLRTETAPLAALAILQARWGDMA